MQRAFSLLTLCFLACATTGGKAMVKAEEPPVQVLDLGQDLGQGNLLLVQAWVDSTDYASTWSLSGRLENYFEQAKSQHWLSPKTVVVLAERWADGLLFAEEDPAVYQARTLDDAYKLLANKYLVDILLRWPGAKGDDRIRSSVHQLKAEALRKSYQLMMSKIAREYGVTLVGGCLLLPAPRVEAGEIAITVDKPLQRACFVFGPDGQVLDPPTLPQHLRGDDRALAEASSAPLPVYQTAAGTLRLLAGDDMWVSASSTHLGGTGPELIVALQDLPVRSGWTQSWNPDVTAGDIQGLQTAGLTYQDAVMKYGLPARLTQAGAAAGGVVYLSGRAWDRHHDGQVLAIKGDQVSAGPRAEAPVLVNLWLGVAPPPEPVVEPEPAPPPKKPAKKTTRKRRGS
ncbi:MAG: hypothetical protein ABIJ09_26420 [Pseudomonadota bacterium]